MDTLHKGDDDDDDDDIILIIIIIIYFLSIFLDFCKFTACIFNVIVIRKFPQGLQSVSVNMRKGIRRMRT